jgi:hypothetical protein
MSLGAYIVENNKRVDFINILGLIKDEINRSIINIKI